MMLADRIAILEEGTLRQMDQPRAVYERPQNLFVAGFLGKLPMNLVLGEFREERGVRLFREVGDGTIEIRWRKEEQPHGIEPFLGRQILVGFRPEEIAPLGRAAEGGGAAFPAIIELAEPMGGETILHLQTGAHRLLCRQPGYVERAEAGHRGKFGFDSARLHFFDPASRQRIE
jgi:multiple sugar transport system ATP-binding protein